MEIQPRKASPVIQTGAAIPVKKLDRVSRNYTLGVIMALAITASFVVGMYVGDKRRPTNSSEIASTGGGAVLNRDAQPILPLHDVDFQQFWEIWKTVKERSVQTPPSDQKMFYGAIAGMVGSLGDPYSVFFDPEYAQQFAKELSGEFEGIGAEIGIKKEQLTVIAPLPGTPAARAGIMAGDRILAIDGVETVGMAVDDAVSRIRGNQGTTVKLHIGRDSLDEPKEIPIVREKITVESVKWVMDNKKGKRIGRITLSHFNERTKELFNAAVREIMIQDPDGIILDLRNDPGGYLDAAVEVAGEWIAHDTVVVEKFSDGTTHPYVSSGNARLSEVPTVVLVNGGSASASEIVAGALQDKGKATLVGVKTFGKGSVQDYSEFSDGSALKLTVALWLTPNGRSINKEGIAPDVVVETTPEDFENDRDPQLDKAWEILVSPVSVAR